MQDLWQLLISSGFFTELIFAIVSTIIGILLYIIDQRGNKRQEEALDIILDQVSKVNQFQTRSLVLAINTLENELNDIKTTVINNQNMLKGSESLTNSPLIASPHSTPDEQVQQPGFAEVMTNKFAKVISDQVNNLVSGIQNDLKDLQTSTPKGESYKKKKGLEFDVKSLLRNLEGLEDLKIKIEGSDLKKPNIQRPPQPGDKIKNIIEPEIVNQDKPAQKDQIENLFDTKYIKEKFGDFEDKLSKISSISDLENIVSSISDFLPKNKENKKKTRRKVDPGDYK